ncbi:hypothetical protein [Kutzneria kofuensis]|uniref:hypothetical protein n=1 Tax=Kutzneria kofuensis TaxID=103725 RepID=UPI0031F08716
MCTCADHNCFARNTHTYLDLDSGHDFDSQVVVKVNAAEALRARLSSPRWTREHVAMGTNTDPYQRAEGRYRLMPGIIQALADTGTPFSILTKGTTMSRDIPLLAAAAKRVPVGLGVSIALLDKEIHHTLEPGTPSPQARWSWSAGSPMPACRAACSSPPCCPASPIRRSSWTICSARSPRRAPPA